MAKRWSGLSGKGTANDAVVGEISRWAERSDINLRRRTGEALSEPIYWAGAELLGRHPGVNKLFRPQRTSEQRTLL